MFSPERAVRTFALFCAALVSAAGLAGADPVRISGGFITFYNDGVATMGIHGERLSAASVSNGSGGPPLFQLPVGTTADLSFDADVFTASGVATVDGTVIRDEDNPASGFIQLRGDFDFDLTPFSVPAAGDGEAVEMFRTSFSMAGVLFGTTQAGAELFRIPVFGSGTASLMLRQLELENGVIYSSLPTLPTSFTFESGEAPVPEPTSVLLLGSGLLGVALRRVRGRRRL